MSTFTLEQKRLEQIRKQLYGKQTVHKTVPSKSDKKIPGQKHHSTTISNHSIKTESYITKDLFKVLVLSTLAISFQLLIHYSLVNNWIHINFYGITY